MRRVLARDRRARSPRCATTTSTGRGCRATRPTPAWRASSAPRSRPARRRGCSRTAASGATSCTCATSRTPTCSRSPRRRPSPARSTSPAGRRARVGDMAAALARAVRRRRRAARSPASGAAATCATSSRRPSWRRERLGFTRARGLRGRDARVRRRRSCAHDALRRRRPRRVDRVRARAARARSRARSSTPPSGSGRTRAAAAAVAAVQLAKLGGDVDFFTALGDDERGAPLGRAAGELRRARPRGAARRACSAAGFVHLDDDGERTISIVGERHAPHGDDELPWERLDGADGVFVSGGDDGALREARRARAARRHAARRRVAAPAGVRLDALVRSGKDRLEQLDPARSTRRRAGRHHRGRARAAPGRPPSGARGTWEAAALPGPEARRLRRRRLVRGRARLRARRRPRDRRRLRARRPRGRAQARRPRALREQLERASAA